VESIKINVDLVSQLEKAVVSLRIRKPSNFGFSTPGVDLKGMFVERRTSSKHLSGRPKLYVQYVSWLFMGFVKKRRLGRDREEENIQHS